MAEIKSTLDLVMEKTKHLTLSAEEKLELQLQDFVKKVPGYMERIFGGALTSEQLLEEIKTLPQGLTERVRREIARQFSQALDLTDKSDPLIPALEVLVEPSWSELLAEVKRCRAEYEEVRAGSEQKARDRILATLAAEGIQGSAVVAKLEGDPLWEAEDHELRRPGEDRLIALREALT
jgi:hypothetical protein